MQPDDKDKNSLYESLIRQGIPREQIERVYRDLRDKGYGEEEVRRRSRAALEGLKPRPVPPPRFKERRPPEALPPRWLTCDLRDAGGCGNADGRRGANRRGRARSGPRRRCDEAGGDAGKRAIDWLPEVPPWLRRRINRYAYRNGFVITRFFERVEDFFSIFDPDREDCISTAFLRLLAERKGYLGENPYALSFADDLDALRNLRADAPWPGSGGQETPEPSDADEVGRALRSREPFALEFFGEFTQPFEMLRKSFDFLESKLASGARVRVAEVARVVKDGGRAHRRHRGR